MYGSRFSHHVRVPGLRHDLHTFTSTVHLKRGPQRRALNFVRTSSVARSSLSTAGEFRDVSMEGQSAKLEAFHVGWEHIAVFPEWQRLDSISGNVTYPAHPCAPIVSCLRCMRHQCAVFSSWGRPRTSHSLTGAFLCTREAARVMIAGGQRFSKKQGSAHRSQTHWLPEKRSVVVGPAASHTAVNLSSSW